MRKIINSWQDFFETKANDNKEDVYGHPYNHDEVIAAVELSYAENARKMCYENLLDLAHRCYILWDIASAVKTEGIYVVEDYNRSVPIMFIRVAAQLIKDDPDLECDDTTDEQGYISAYLHRIRDKVVALYLAYLQGGPYAA